MKLFELRPLAATLMTSTAGLTTFRNPAPHPESSVTVESPTRTMRIGAGWVQPFGVRARAATVPAIASAIRAAQNLDDVGTAATLLHDRSCAKHTSPLTLR